MVDVREYLEESNAIENVYGEAALDDALAAWEYLKQQEELTHEVIKKAHDLLLANRQPDIAGEYRSVRVRVGRDLPPNPDRVPDEMDQLLSTTVYTPIDALRWHVEFEKIHPFADGNGRIGRLLYLWHCTQLGVDPIMWREEDVGGYYALFDVPIGDWLNHNF